VRLLWPFVTSPYAARGSPVAACRGPSVKTGASRWTHRRVTQSTRSFMTTGRSSTSSPRRRSD